MKKILLWLIRFYQDYLSPLKGVATCRFYPTCSSYAMQAIQSFGVVKGLWLSVKRVMRCNPLFKGGIDPIPEQFFWFHQSVQDTKQREK